MKKGTRYYNPITGTWHDECPWPDGKMPDGGRICVDTMLMDSLPADVATHLAGNKPAMSDQERARVRAQASQDHFDHHRSAKPRGHTMFPVSDAYVAYCDRMQRGAA